MIKAFGLIELMRHVSESPLEIHEKGEYAKQRALKFTNEGMVDAFEAVLKREGHL